MKVLLIGNPNVGKSAIFSRLTGTNVIISNYSGTTVEFKKGNLQLKDKSYEIIDVPGTYSLSPTNKAEEVAVDMLKQGDLIINILDSTNLERNLNLTLQLMEKNVPMIIVLNMWDETKHTGIDINKDKLEQILKLPVIPTVAVTGEGIKKLVDSLPKAKKPESKTKTEKERWEQIGKTIKEVQTTTHRHHTFLETLSDASIKPLPGAILALIVISISFFLIRFIGESLISYIFDPLFNLYTPLITSLGNLLQNNFLHDILIGNLIGGQVDYLQSMGLLTTGLYVPIAMVLPYVFAFYLILGFLEDFGYLPRLAVLVDNIMHKIGLHGFAIIPVMMGFGCNVPGALATRVLESRKEKFIAATMMAISVPCIAQTAMVFGLVGKHGLKGLAPVFLTLFIVGIVIGLILNKLTKGKSPELFMEISPYRIPYLNALLKKLWMRSKSFLRTAVPYMLVGVLIINLLYSLGIIAFVSNVTAPIVVNVLGLPKEAVASLIIGFLRKDVAVGALIPLALSLKQLIIASVVLTMYFPCVATFTVLIKELGIKDMIKSSIIMVVSTLIVGGLLNIIL
ncbi:MAG: ferrous iron transporter B [Candidatus Woesearchaeota archaeon]|jgi:ferrous iron transport protein B|nr:ferrous iron transporter B [Candidatus Woesearchaeota archaeon]